MADTYHLQNRKGVWYYLRRVPLDLQPAFGVAVVKTSLRTRDKSEAKKRRTVEDIKFDARATHFLSPGSASDIASTQSTSTIDDLLDYVRLAVSMRDQRSAHALIADPPRSAMEKKELVIDADIEFQILDDPDDPRGDLAIHSFITRVMKDADVSLPSQLMPQVRELGRRALIELSRRRIDRYADRFDHPYYDPIFAPQKVASVSFQTLVKEFLKEVQEDHAANSVGKQRQKKVKAFADALLEIVGPSTRVEEMDDKAVQRVRTVLAKLPTNRPKIFGDLALDEVLIRTAAEARPTLSSTTQSDYLRVFKQLMKFAARRKYLASDPSVEAKPLTKPIPLEDRRRPFTLEQIKQIFGSKFYHQCAVCADKPYDRSDRDWRFWFPLLMLFSAARPNEIAQLCAADVRRSEAGNLYLNLMPDSMQLKTLSSRRRIPLHNELIALGFVSFVEARKAADGSKARLFPTLKPNDFGNMAWYANKRFNEVFLPAVIKVEQNQSFYSLRHSVRDALRRANATPEVLRAIGGWAENGRSTSDFYGDATDPDLYVEWVNAISYPGLDLSFLYH